MKVKIKITKLLRRVGEIRDPRRDYGNKRHSLVTILMIGLITFICGGKDFSQMEECGRKKFDWLSKFLDMPNGVPDSDTFRRVFERVDPKALSECLEKSLRDSVGAIKSVAIDGKTCRGSADGKHSAYHIVSAWAGEHHLTLGQVAVDEKSNEIMAIPTLLETLDIEGAVVTIDAMGCQKNIAEAIIGRGADYCLTLKANHKNFYKAVEATFDKIDAEKAFTWSDDEGETGSSELLLDTYETASTGHGRSEKREISVISASLFKESAIWTGLKSIVRCEYTSVNTATGKLTSDTRYFLTSLPASARRISGIIRNHWSIENQLHWVLDVVFEEDASHAAKDNSPINLNILRKTTLTLLNRVKGKRESYSRLMFRAALDTDFLELVFVGG